MSNVLITEARWVDGLATGHGNSGVMFTLVQNNVFTTESQRTQRSIAATK
jgi:hypothetical protein